MNTNTDPQLCYHCGNELPAAPEIIVFQDKKFCCLGCQTVYEILTQNHLEGYYQMEKSPGAKPQNPEKYAFLENKQIVEKLLDFHDADTQIVTLYIPHIHCSSCIWVLENLHKLHKGVAHSLVNFPKKTVRITYRSSALSLKELVTLLAHIGYAPYISLEDYKHQRTEKHQKVLLYKLGVAGFVFGNVMLFSFPEYFEQDEFWIDQYKYFFRWLTFFLSLPVVFYSASDYFVSAYKGLRSRVLNIDIPLALGILAMFLRSVFDIVTDSGQGFFDSLCGLVFFLLLGKFFQQKTYNFLSFERDYKSYFPIGVTRISPHKEEENIQVYDIEQGDRLLIRNQELIPVDALLISPSARIDYSFVTGEAIPIAKASGEKLFAGGKQIGTAIEVQALKTVSQSYLTQLWSHEVFQKNKSDALKTLTDRVSQYFTVAIVAVALLSFAFWVRISPQQAFNVFTAVLIIACPCALAMSAPFTLGNVLRILGKRRLYLKNAQVIEQMAKVDTIIFDKTGTITHAGKASIHYQGAPLSPEILRAITAAVRNSHHPLSRQLYQMLKENPPADISSYQEISGKGIEVQSGELSLKIGSAEFVGATPPSTQQTSVFISVGGQVQGCYIFANAYREGMPELFRTLSQKYRLAILSGDNSSEEKYLQTLLPAGTQMRFGQRPEDKLQYVADQQAQGFCVMMVGDGLNDAGALQQSHVGVALSEDINVFSPACDAILDARALPSLPTFLHQSRTAMRIIKWSFALSLLYNLVGLSFAIAGKLSPVIAALLMPISSISVVLFTTLATNLSASLRSQPE